MHGREESDAEPVTSHEGTGTAGAVLDQRTERIWLRIALLVILSKNAPRRALEPI